MGALSEFTTYAKATGSRLSDQPLLFEATRHLDVTQRELFNYVTDFDRLSEWIWASKKTWSDDTKAEAPGQVGAVRMIQGAACKPIRETVKEFEAPRMLAYSANDGAFFGTCTDHLGVFACEPHPDGGTVACWLAYGRLPRSAVKAWLGTKLFQVALGNGMKNLERKFPPR
jgi:uncharacterized protein YndB with AHSA1/START domain